MSSGMNTEQAKEYAKTMTYREAVSNIRHAKGIKYRKATRIKLRELAEIADRLDRKTEQTEPQTDLLVTEYPQDGEVYLIGRDKTEAVVMAYDVYKELTEPQTKCYLRTSCDHYGDKQVCGRCREYNLYSHTKDKPQTDYKMPYEDCEDCETHLKAQYGFSW